LQIGDAAEFEAIEHHGEGGLFARRDQVLEVHDLVIHIFEVGATLLGGGQHFKVFALAVLFQHLLVVDAGL
jgi:hypothetical protein